MSHPYEVQIDFISGACGAVASVCVGQPLDTIKVKMQTFPSLNSSLALTFTQTIKSEGFVLGLYAGVAPALVANMTENSILFASYGACQKLVANFTRASHVDQLSPAANGVSGFLAGFWSSLALCPLELIKCRLQTAREASSTGGLAREASSTEGLVRPKVGTFSLTRDILKREGVLGLYRGLTATMGRDMPGYFFFFSSYEFTRELLKTEGTSKDDIGPLKTIVSGGVAGVALWTCMFPVDVVKSRIQVTGDTTAMWRVMRQIYLSEGVSALYKGLPAQLWRTFPSAGALFFTYEYSKKILEAMLQRK